MNRLQDNKIYFLMSLGILLMIGLVANANAQVDSFDEPKVLVIYSSETGEMDEYQRALDLYIGHFTTNMIFKNVKEVGSKDLVGITHLFYYGQVEERLPLSLLDEIKMYPGYFIAIGHNSEQLGGHFSFVKPLNKQVIDSLVNNRGAEDIQVISPEYIVNTELTNESEILLEGSHRLSNTTFPIVVKNEKHYYIALDNLSGNQEVWLGEIFHEIFKQNHEAKNPAYIRLEDIHPLVNPLSLKQITDELHERGIPYMMAVIPVYTNPETGQQFHFSDSPKLLKVLKEAQKKGGSIILHGYTHQFRESETGEGFEFWDVKHNTPIYAEADQEFSFKKLEDFDNEKLYSEYLQNLKEFETSYIREKVTRGIQELTNYGLYPLAFEAPHYTMSQNGYKVIAEYFSTYVGQIQMSDNDWEIMYTTPYITKPSFLNGLELLPETIGYVDPQFSNAIPLMMDKANQYQQSDDAVIGAFFHPYLGVDSFLTLLHELEKLENITWIDLKERDIWVRAESIEIRTVSGEIIPHIQHGKLLLSSMDYPLYHLNRGLSFGIWVMAIIGSLLVLLFILFTLNQTRRKMKTEVD